MKQKILAYLRTLKFSWPWHAIAGYLGFVLIALFVGPWLALAAVGAAAYITEEWDRIKVAMIPDDWAHYWKTYGWKDWAWYFAGALPAFFLQIFGK